MPTGWRFVDSEADGQIWLKRPEELMACVQFSLPTPDGASMERRAMIVTRGWLEKHLRAVRESESGPLWAGIPALLVVPDATGDKLRGFVDRVVRDGGIDDYSVAI
jgi:hypothetical protein